MGTPGHLLGVLKEIRTKIGKQVGDQVEVVLQEDTAPRAVAVPPDFAAALRSAPRAKAFFETLAHTYRREYVQWVEDAKRQDTRRDRVARAVTLLEQEKKEDTLTVGAAAAESLRRAPASYPACANE